MTEYGQIFDSGLLWIESNLNRFSIRDITCEARRLRLMKPLGELALTADIVLRSGLRLNEKLSERLQRVLLFAWEEFQCGDLLAQIIRDHPNLFIIFSLYPSFKRHGYESFLLEKELDICLSLKGTLATEYPAWRALDIAVAVNYLKGSSFCDIQNIYLGTWLSKLPEPWSLTVDTAYALTHTVFYMTDFGENPNTIPSSHMEFLREWVPVWQKYFVFAEDLDLTAEMTMVLRCIGILEDGLEVAMLTRRAQENDGLIPGPKGGGSSLVAEEVDSAQQRFLRNYHTTLVSIIAAWLTLRPSQQNAELLMPVK